MGPGYIEDNVVEDLFWGVLPGMLLGLWSGLLAGWRDLTLLMIPVSLGGFIGFCVCSIILSLRDRDSRPVEPEVAE